MSDQAAEQPIGVLAGQGYKDSSNDRYRMIVSDGVKFCQAMLTTQLNYVIKDGVVGKNSVFRVNRITGNTVSNRRYVPTVLEVVTGRRFAAL